jgi:hypothetical protein
MGKGKDFGSLYQVIWPAKSLTKTSEVWLSTTNLELLLELEFERRMFDFVEVKRRKILRLKETLHQSKYPQPEKRFRLLANTTLPGSLGDTGANPARISQVAVRC